ncbi:NAD(+) diphosphatase [Alcanivorax sp. 1008]|uniref:NAD(+) diphosphatase n=1 Tax=Alcanivorax sp. 1008 TaxID=2816853 RepID=UPI001D8FB637|nr:NAD(+) diphosphatase [Alcanivorax sp. 1008]MCC1496407.1 NAD(+) diphosphatase [Alcanivorax sp. 1008]
MPVDIEFGPAPAQFEAELRLFVFHQGRVLINEEGSGALLPSLRAGMARMLFPGEQIYLGCLDGQHCCAVSLEDDTDPPQGFFPEELRRLIHLLPQGDFMLASRAMQLFAWRRDHRFCSRCGAVTMAHNRDMAMVCPACQYTQYPRITPCIITLVTKGDEILLAHGARFPEGLFSCLAGFMEPGEDAEHAVRREVREETGLRVGKLRYHGSQSWPFPHSLMLAFHADYEGGDLVPDGVEIIEAGWFSRDNLPRVPPPGSISRSLIDDWIQRGGV